MTTLLRRWPVFLLASCGLAWLLQSLLFAASGVAKAVVCLGLAGLYGAVLLGLTLGKARLSDHAVPLVLCASFLVQLFFVLRMPYTFSWHDLGGLGNLADDQVNAGHLGYIAYLVKFGHLPDLNPLVEAYKDFYHPPLHHLLEAGFLKLNLLLGLPLEVAAENLQIPTLFYASLCVYVIYRILLQLGLSPRGIRAGLLSAAFQPVFFLYAATVNNDILSLLFILLACYFTLRWSQQPTLFTILGIALTLGLGMATKLSAGLLALPIGLVFALRFFSDLPHWKKYLLPFGLFLLVSVPLGIAWPVHNALRWQMPLQFVPLPAETLNVSHLPLSDRFGLPSSEALHSLFYSGIRKVDYNVWFQALKTGLFDELTLFPLGSPLWYMSYCLTVGFAGLIAWSLVGGVRLLLSKNGLFRLPQKTFLGVYAAGLLFSYLLFCYQYPYICTFNFRYLMPAVLLCAIALAFWCEKKSISAKLTEMGCWCFAGLSCFVYAAYIWAA